MDAAVSRVARVAVCGDYGAGKTCLVRALCGRAFDVGEPATLGAECSCVREADFSLASALGHPRADLVTLEVFDTAGQERFRSLLPTYFRHADLVLVVAAAGPPSAVGPCLGAWADFVRAHSSAPLVFVVSKADSGEAPSWLGDFRTSAVTGAGVPALRDALFARAHALLDAQETPRGEPRRARAGCCR